MSLGEDHDDKSRTKRTLGEIKKLAYDDIDTVLMEYQAEAADIDAQIRKAKAQQKSTGEYRDPQWFSKATNALKIRRLYITVLCERKKALRQEHRKMQSMDFDRGFRLAAKRMLTPEMYDTLAEAATVDTQIHTGE